MSVLVLFMFLVTMICAFTAWGMTGIFWCSIIWLVILAAIWAMDL